MAEGRLGLGIPTHAFVIAEDRSLGARAQACWRWARYEVLRLLVRGRRAGRFLTARFSTPSTLIPASARPSRVFSRVNGILAFLGLIAAVFVLMRHLLRRGDAVQAATRRTGHKTGLIAIGLIFVAFLAALLIPERVEPVRQAEARVMDEPARMQAGQPALVDVATNPTPSPTSISAQPAHWQPLRRPMAMFHLESPELAGLEMNYRVSMRGTSRQDTLIWLPKPEGAGATRRALAQIVIERHEGSMTTAPPLFADLAGRAAEQHLVVERMARPQEIATKFGPMEAAEMTIRQGDRAHACIGFRRIDMAGLTLVGWACGSRPRPVDRVALGCFLDRLDLVGGGRDQGLRRLFAEAERARMPCSSSRQSGKRLTWLDHESPMPGLKLSARSR